MKTLLLIDANGLIHRAFHALPALTSPQGEMVNALYGLASILIKIIKEQKPDYLAAAFDRPETTFRKEMFEGYKAHRLPAAKELISQIIKAHELFEKFGIRTFEKAGFEADDVIATLAKKFKKTPDLKIVILTGDLDALQLVEKDKVVVQFLKKGVSETFTYNEKAVVERFSLKPHQLNDYKGLVGDPSDNLPGISGIGPKTASRLLSQYKNLENVFLKINPADSLAKKILPQKEKALFSKKLAVLSDKVPLKINLKTLDYPGLPLEKVVKYFGLLGFQSLIKRIINQPLPNQTLFQTKSPKPAPMDIIETNQILIISDLETALNLKKKLAGNWLKIAFDWHKLLEELKKAKVEVREPLFDLKIAAWLIDSGQENYSLDILYQRFLQKNFQESERGSILKELYFFLNQKLESYGLNYVFREVEMPLIKILLSLEERGVHINQIKLKKLRQKLLLESKSLVQKIYQETGLVFNLNSPKQLSRILYEKLKIQFPKSRKTASGFFSTAEAILNQLKNGYPLVDLILKYREATKIKNTYVEPILKLLGKDGRLHTHFLQTGTSTGRLSSEKPNLQSIPQESVWAKFLRETFEAEKGWHLVSFDYSQLELRLLAELSEDDKLKEVFKQNQDIHQVTASEVLHLPPEQITDSLRRLGKTLNFGIIYGIGAKSFAQAAGLNEAEAKKFIEEYFRHFPKIKIWQEKIKAEVRTFGYIKNLNGRRRWFWDIISTLPRIQSEMERAAINMPIQSLGADILKMSMIKIFKDVQEKKWENKVKMVLSLHDELLFEIKDDMLEIAKLHIKKTMEEIFPLSIPLQIETEQGKNWGEME